MAPRDRAASPLTVRLVVAQTVVLLAGLAIVVVAAAVIGPSMFYYELVRAGHHDAAAGLVHLEDELRSVSLTALAIGAVPALYVAGLLGFLLHRAFGRSLGAFTRAAGEVAGGNYAVRVESPGLGPEFDSLTRSFNDMAARLDTVESTRRRMLADLAHEMRTPLATLKGHLEGVQDGVLEWDERTARILDAQIARLERLARDIRSLTQAEEATLHLRPVPVDPAELAAQAVAAAAPAASARHVTLHARGTPGTTVPLDPERTGQVLGNLLENALRHTPAGGNVTVTTEHGRGEVVVTVADTGEGIDAEHLPHVFERFYRGPPGREASRSGSGLGLAISKALVEAQGGTLEADSPGPGAGAVFRIRWPLPGTTA
ncbi:HAMP domain-containing histidine kinase [Kocuria sp. LUK]|nr:HAMP domain-containing histidine kinase [Kocuria sp. LUK]